VGLPFAVGAKAVKPDTQVIGLHGDGSLGQNAMELDIAVRPNCRSSPSSVGTAAGPPIPSAPSTAAISATPAMSSGHRGSAAPPPRSAFPTTWPEPPTAVQQRAPPGAWFALLDPEYSADTQQLVPQAVSSYLGQIDQLRPHDGHGEPDLRGFSRAARARALRSICSASSPCSPGWPNVATSRCAP